MQSLQLDYTNLFSSDLIIARVKNNIGKAGHGYVIYPGQMTLPLGKGVMTLPLANL